MYSYAYYCITTFIKKSTVYWFIDYIFIGINFFSYIFLLFQTNQSKWQILFIIFASVQFVTNLIFVIFAKGTVQEWNFYSEDEKGWYVVDLLESV